MLLRSIVQAAGWLGGPLLQACLLMSCAGFLTYYYVGSIAAFSLKDFAFVGVVGASVLIHRLRLKSYIEHDPTVRLLETATPAYDLDSLEYYQGARVRLGEDEVIAVLFFGTWCKSSRVALREFQKVFDQYGGAVKFVAVTQEDKTELDNYAVHGTKASYFTPLQEFRFGIATESGALTKGYQLAHGISTVPHVYLIGRDDSIFWHGHPLGKFEDATRRTLAYDFDRAAKKKAA
ncbi:hypothetical protein SDRG_06686 [Saprolegnia diclina VS20]|uniref:Thioredoxin domain-containing protein n=1 Tax=Saprolegnia diclina (strain VS20) TaxID=1156394 RepID=T0QMM4_SAPDV|nr:hypothetical protein SDRG_06686 [Saprolegnia diclina VS20]EQC35941.1 hypothetical protein SDRG_06686 [Saprolegnia diclina VS20]|eukprot:XP_008610703.1 hypothetical protein SDRG_06686 [Saprolegnia diclina VS20]